jgi:hypothetical protein
VLEDAAECANSIKCRLKAAAVISHVIAVEPRFIQSRELTPLLAGWVRHDRIWPVVESSVAFLVPRIDSREVPVDAAALDEECGNRVCVLLAGHPISNLSWIPSGANGSGIASGSNWNASRRPFV